MLGVDTLTVGVPLSIVTAKEFLKLCLYFTEEEADNCIREMALSKGKYKAQLCDRISLRKLIEYGKYIRNKTPIKFLRFAFFPRTCEFCLIICVSPIEVLHYAKAKPTELFSGNDEAIGEFHLHMANIIATICWNAMMYTENRDIRAELKKAMFFNNIYLLRIDYTADLKANEEKVPLYISLYNSTVLEKQRFQRSNKFKHNCVRVKNKQTAVVLYDKKAQLERCYPEYADEAAGIIRYEVQHKKTAKIRSIKKEYGGLNINLLYREVALAQLLHYWRLLLPEGDFLKWNALIKKLDELNTRLRNKCISDLKFSQLKHSIATAIKKYWAEHRSSYSSEERAQAAFYKSIKAISSLGIAPYAVPVEKSVNYGIHKYDYGSCLPSLFAQIA